MRYVQKFEMITIDLNDPDFDMGRYSVEAQAMLTTMQVINELDDRDTLCRLLRDKVRPAYPAYTKPASPERMDALAIPSTQCLG